jgi:hypothetical protein
MKLLLLALMLSVNSGFAGVGEVKKVFEQEKKYGSSGEASLDAEILKGDKEVELGKILGQKLVDFSGLTFVKTHELHGQKAEMKKQAMDLLIDNSFGSPFYCDYFEQDWDWNQTKNCRKSVDKILEVMLTDKDIATVYLVEIGGDYYGDWARVLLVGMDYDNDEAIVIDFDMIHEI